MRVGWAVSLAFGVHPPACHRPLALERGRLIDYQAALFPLPQILPSRLHYYITVARNITRTYFCDVSGSRTLHPCVSTPRSVVHINMSRPMLEVGSAVVKGTTTVTCILHEVEHAFHLCATCVNECFNYSTPKSISALKRQLKVSLSTVSDINLPGDRGPLATKHHSTPHYVYPLRRQCPSGLLSGTQNSKTGR